MHPVYPPVIIFEENSLIRRNGLNLLNELGKKIRCEAVPTILSVFPNEFNKFNNTGARLQDSIYHMTLKSHFISKFCTKRHDFAIRKCDVLWPSTHDFRHNLHI